VFLDRAAGADKLRALATGEASAMGGRPVERSAREGMGAVECCTSECGLVAGFWAV